MTDLAKRLLASIDNHGRSHITGVYDLYPHEGKEVVKEALYELKRLGWIKISMTTINKGVKGNPDRHRVEKNISRTNKRMFKQSKIIYNDRHSATVV